jgi:putative transcriptional regulator
VTLHHPYDDTLARYAAGRLGAGPSLVLSAHLSGCAECRARVRLFEAVGGALIEEAPVRPVRPDLFAENLRRLDALEAPVAASARPGFSLDGLEMTPWRRVTRSFQWRRVLLPEAPEANVIMLKVAPGQKMPHHSHSGTEYTQILQGSFHDDFGRYVAGDCVEADEEVEHQPIVDSEMECVCLAAVDGRLKLSGWLGRLAQPFVGV